MNSDIVKLRRFRAETVVLAIVGTHFWGWMGGLGGFLFAAYFLQPHYSEMPPIRRGKP